MIPSTPAKGKTWLPVRYIGVRSHGLDGLYDTTLGSDDKPTIQRRVEPDWDLYTLLPPHLADQWAELRKRKAQAEEMLLARLKLGRAGHGDAASTAWVAACEVLVHFESTNGIGGGA